MKKSEHIVVLNSGRISISIREIGTTNEYYVESEATHFLEIFGEKGIILLKGDTLKDEQIIELLEPQYVSDGKEILRVARREM